METLRARLDAIVAEHNLLNHPFYQAWSAGTLPKEALATYASEWGNFVAQVPKGWAAHGDVAVAAEERTHVELWGDFAESLGAEVAPAQVAQVRSLNDCCDRNFGDPVASIGALYAFEAQQPGTSVSKLTGLREHYRLAEKGHEYFRVHCDDVHEMELLAERAARLSQADQDRAVDACRETAVALWDALTGIHEMHCATA